MQLCNHYLFQSLELRVIYIPVLASIIKYLYVVTTYGISGIAVLQKIWTLAIAPPFYCVRVCVQGKQIISVSLVTPAEVNSLAFTDAVLEAGYTIKLLSVLQ